MTSKHGAATTGQEQPPTDAESSAESADGATDYKAELLDVIDRAKAPYDRVGEEQLAHRLRVIVANAGGDLPAAAMATLFIMRGKLRGEHATVTDAQLEESDQCIGVHLFGVGRTEEAIEVTLREARLLRSCAQQFLEQLYATPAQGVGQYDPRILAFFRDTAREGLDRSLLFLGKIVINGWGVKADEDLGIQILQECGLPEAQMELAGIWIEREEWVAANRTLRAAADAGIPQAYYNLGVLAQQAGEYADAIVLFDRTLELDPAYHAARLELARMYTEGWGTAVDAKKAFDMYLQVSIEGDGRVAAIAHANIGVHYRDGRGVPVSKAKAREHFVIAAEGGIDEARQMLDEMKSP